MILYFADRYMGVIGHASTELPEGLTVINDKKIEEIETGVATFECTIPYDDATRAQVESCAAVGNYLLRSHNKENEFYTIIESETDTKAQQVLIYAEDAGMDLINEIFGEYEADKAYPISYYVEKYASGAGFEIGINEIPDLTRKLVFDSEQTGTARLASVAAAFDGCEVSYTFDVDGLTVIKKYVNIYKERGADHGVQLRLNKEIDNIVTTKTIADIATALECTGGTPDNADEPITLKNYKYDDGDFYVDGTTVKSRNALEQWGRFLWKNDDTALSGGHITRPFSHETTSPAELCTYAIRELKQLREMGVNYDVEIMELPDDVRVGDWVSIVDDAGELYLSSRLLVLERSVAKQTIKATLGEYLLKGSGISQKVMELAAQFAKVSQSATRALSIANTAKANADAAAEQADAALSGANAAQEVANEAKESVDTATQSAAEATEAANNAQAAVKEVEDKVTSLEETVTNAQTAAENAQQAATTATQKADEAKAAADQAALDAAEAKTSADEAKADLSDALSKAEEAISTAGEAKTLANDASATAAGAKADAEQAQADIDSLGESLTTLESTMKADYARKTDLTEATASLQTQITQNADEISSTATKVQEIDETANNAAELATAANTTAEAAQTAANAATTEAQEAQAAADNAKTAADAAQSEADAAKAAAATAQGVADKAEADLEAAKADLATVSGRVDATEADIAAAQERVATAQAAADQAKTDAAAAVTEAANAQTVADTAATDAANAQTVANNAANAAALAQQVADEAKGNAEAAQTKADEAAAAAANAQETANTAKENATNAQNTANEAAQAAAAAQKAADDADIKAAQAAADLETAKKNLADVTSRVDATQEEVEAAQAAVETAQAAADKAKSDAATAQETANTAKTNAEAAQTAADEAQAAADTAQAAADEAQAAADKAQADVDALAVRVTSAETKITQNAEQIALRATKTEVTETLGGYYTKEETDAAILVESDEIKSTVSSQINEMEIGGRNLLENSSFAENLEKWTNNGAEITSKDDVPCAHIMGELNTTKYVNQDVLDKVILEQIGQEYTFSADILCENYVAGSTNPFLSLYFSGSYDNNGTSEWMGATTISSTSSIAAINNKGWTRIKWTFAFWHKPTSLAAYLYARDFTGDVYFKNLKLEKGIKGTDWTPAVEDVDEATQNAQATAGDAAATAASNENRVTLAESEIQQLADMIATLVTDGNGASLMTQTEEGWTFSVGEIVDTLTKATEEVGDLSQSVDSANSSIDSLKQAVNDLGVMADYVVITTYNDQPCIELGEIENGFKLRITNTEIQFADGTVIPAYVSNKKLMIEQAEVKSELQFGGFVWTSRENGNIGLLWKGVDG